MKIPLLLLIIGFWANIQAQDYHLLKSGRFGLFYVSGKDVFASIRVKEDTVLGGDTILILPTRIEKLNDTCYTAYGPSFLGPQIILRDSSEHLLFNRWGDTLRFRLGASLQEAWPVWADSGFYITGRVISHEPDSFLGLVDSLKTIAFQMHDSNHQAVPHAVDSLFLRVSQHHGIVESPDLSFFPNVPPKWRYGPQTRYRLAGINTPEAGMQPLTWREVWDFSPGDEWHVEGHHLSDGFVLTKTINRILSREDLGDSVTYLLDKEVEIFGPSYNPFHSYTRDTTQMGFRFHPGTDRLSWEAYNRNEANVVMMLQDTLTPSSTWLDLPSIITYDSGLCWFPVGLWGQDTYCLMKYTRGLGGPYFEDCRFAGSTATYSEILVYYRKDSLVYGTPLLIASQADMPEPVGYQLGPNPTAGPLWVSPAAGQPGFRFELFDIQGRKVFVAPVPAGGSVLDLSALPPGLYLYRVHRQGHLLGQGKLLRH